MGLTCAMFYMSFFGHLVTIDQPDRGLLLQAALTAAIGLLFAVTAVGFAGSLAARSRE